MHTDMQFLALLGILLVILAGACSCSAGSRQGDAGVPCETVVAIWALVECPGAPPLFPPKP